jgi:hypothetical protein
MNITFIIFYVNVWSPDLGLCQVALSHATAKTSSKFFKAKVFCLRKSENLVLVLTRKNGYIVR